jgi:hypothetical protein
MSVDTQQLRQALLAANDPEGAAIITDPSTLIEVYPAAFLQQYRIYRILYQNPYRPILLYLGFAPNSPLYWLAGNPQAYSDLARADQVDLATPSEAINYATVFLEVTRDMSELFYPVNSVDGIKFYPTPTEEETQARDAIHDKYRWTITSPVAEAVKDEYIVTAYVVRQQELERHELKISRSGDVESNITVLEQNMPVVSGL